MSNLDNVSALVRHILVENKSARNSDNVLYALVIEQYAKKDGIDLEEMKFKTFISKLEHHVFPAFETVRRSRQKVQENSPELCAVGRVERRRTKEERQYRKFAKGSS